MHVVKNEERQKHSETLVLFKHRGGIFQGSNIQHDDIVNSLGDSEGQESLIRCSSWGCKELDMT